MGGAVEAGLLIAGTAIKTYGEYDAAQEKKRALDRLRMQEELESNEEAIRRERKMEQVLSVQRAEGAARGVEPTSASLAAISAGTFNEFAEDEEAANLNLTIKEDAIDIEKHKADRGFMWNAIGNLFSAANRYNDLYLQNAGGGGNPSGTEIDNVFATPKLFDSPDLFKSPQLFAGPMDLKKYNQEELNKLIGF